MQKLKTNPYYQYAANAVIPYPLTQEIGADYLAIQLFALASHKSIRKHRYDPDSHQMPDSLIHRYASYLPLFNEFSILNC